MQAWMHNHLHQTAVAIHLLACVVNKLTQHHSSSVIYPRHIPSKAALRVLRHHQFHSRAYTTSSSQKHTPPAPFYSGSCPPNCWRGIFTLVPNTKPDYSVQRSPAARVLRRESARVPTALLVAARSKKDIPDGKLACCKTLGRRQEADAKAKASGECSLASGQPLAHWHGPPPSFAHYPAAGKRIPLHYG